jgi:quinol monooxygenase YgiN
MRSSSLIRFAGLVLPAVMSFSQLPPTSVVGVNVRIHSKPQAREKCIQLLDADAVGSREEPNCLQFVFGQDTDTENVFHIHEQYKTMADFERHQQNEYFKAVVDFVSSSDNIEDNGFHIDVFSCYNEDNAVIPPRDAYCLNVALYIKPEHQEEFFNVIDNNMKGTRSTEPLGLQYDWGEHLEEPNSFHFHEEYKGGDEGKEGFNAHAKAPHFGVWEKFVSDRDPFTKPPVVSFFRTSSAKMAMKK